MKEHFSMLIKKSLDASSEGLHFKQIVDFCKEQKWLSQNQLDELIRSDGNVYSITPKCFPTDPRIPELLALVERMGCAIYKRNIPKDHGPNPIAWSIVREATMRDLKNAEYILVYSWGMSSGSYAEWPSLLEEVPVFYKRDPMDRLIKQKFLWYGTKNSGAVNAGGKTIIENAGIKGVKFNPVQWQNPNDAKGDLWNLQFDKTMPTCLLPVVVAYDGSKYYDEGPYFPPILRFRRSEIEAMGEWDVARTAELTGVALSKDSPVLRPQCIISARFRDILLSNKISLAGHPVVLVDE